MGSWRGRGVGNQDSAIIVHSIAIIIRTYITGMGVLTICIRVSIAVTGMAIDIFCICKYIIVYIPSDNADCHDACVV